MTTSSPSSAVTHASPCQSGASCFPLAAQQSAAHASRHVSRWLQADAGREARMQELARLSLVQPDFTELLQKEIAAGLPLARAMRRLRNLLLASLVERDLNGSADLAEVLSCISLFADFVVQTHVRALHQELQAIYGTPIGEESGLAQELMVIGMGKLGAHELNVSSDIDLIFVYGEDGETRAASGQKSLSNQEFFTRLGKKLIAAIAEITEDGYCVRVDMALRPNGNSGPLVASLAMLEEYLIVQGREWERYAWVKARALTGSPADIAALEAIVRPFVYRRYLDFGVIASLRNMHAQIRAEVTRQERLRPERSNNVKLGRGGIREIEFLAQVFQLIRGGREASLRQRSTRAILRELATHDLMSQTTVEELLATYTFLRNIEHRLQYLDDAQTHSLPSNEEDVLRIAQMAGFATSADLLACLDQHRKFVAAQFDAIFADKAQNDNPNQLDPDSHSGEQEKEEAICAQLQQLGFEDAKNSAKRLLAAWQTPRLQSLPDASRTRLLALLNNALPLIAQVAKESQGRYSMTASLTRLMDFFEAIARRAAYLSLLSEYPHTLERVIRMISASHWAAQFLNRHPILLDELLDDNLRLATTDWRQLALQLQTQLADSAGDVERQLDILREVHHAQLFRLLAQDLAGALSVEALADQLSNLADTIVAATVQAAWQHVPKHHLEVPRFAVIAYGRLGGKELGYVSDLDVIFLFDDDADEAQMLYAKLAQRFITWMTTHTPAGILFDIDTALRPDGASGMLVSSLSAFERYQHNSAWVWEHQALSRARFCAGDAAIGARFEQIRLDVLCKQRDPQQLRLDVLAMRKKMRDAYGNKAGQLFDLKQDAGGMIDIEFIVQYLVLLHAHQYPQLCGNKGNIALLKMCAELGLIETEAAQAVADAYRTLRKLQHQCRLQGEDKARVALETVENEVKAVLLLWQAVFAEAL
ncbi:MAG: bifunctional [glutamate--ammonia ligase]-adenylyl-L-tyrosine phosphorylase/[glutamate--ammonia-ligase] adenylyltransferase [Burkholderiales bacterium]|nr:bifunctional [glutamate--ammonia ligase]-adenylyl-L-tyrosine phosphorylase/[glutamate--ammonia-ligase] adenylyltransferase [Burkholderiales bacterium]